MFAQTRLTGPVSRLADSRSVWCRLALLLLPAICFFPVDASAGHPGIFMLEGANTWRVDGDDYLEAQFSIELSSGAKEAVQNGVPLVFELQAQVVETHTWLWDSIVIEFTWRRSLQYNALSESYQVKNYTDDTQGNYRRLDDALLAAGKIDSVSLTDEGESLDRGPSYSIRLRGSLDVESLPTPVRLIAYVSSDWDMVSKWYKWPLVR